jgi:hypothetical protein
MRNKGLNKNTGMKPKGFDFGFEMRSLLVGSPEFVSCLKRADISALGYGAWTSPAIGKRIPGVSFIGINPEHLAKLFAEFSRWGADEDGDVVEIAFVFLSQGGYLLAVGPEHGRLLRRLGQFDQSTSHLLLKATWVKHFPSSGPMIDRIREYKMRFVSPFLLGVATYDGDLDPKKIDPQNIKPLEQVKEILKFEAEFVDERNTSPDTLAGVAIRLHRKQVPPFPPKGKMRAAQTALKNDPRGHFRRRASIISTHFPVTVERLRNREEFRNQALALGAEGIRTWQYEQAMVNILMSRTLCDGRLLYPQISPKDLSNRILDAVRKRFEFANGNDPLRGTTLSQIQEQIRYDALALLRGFQALPRKKDLASLQFHLMKNQLLDETNG